MMKKLIPLLSLMVSLFLFSSGFANPIFEPENFSMSLMQENLMSNDDDYNPYPYYFDAVFSENGKWQIRGMDGSRWEILPLPKAESVKKILSSWKKNDEIRLSLDLPADIASTLKQKGLFIIRNLNQNSSVIGFFVSPPLIENLTYRIASIDKNGYFITLNDDSDWTIGWLWSWDSCKWRKDDRIIVVKRAANYYYLINADRNNHVSAEMTSWQ